MRYFGVLVTHGSLNSPHVEKEVLQAQSENKKIIPYFYRPAKLRLVKWGLNDIEGVEFNDKFS